MPSLVNYRAAPTRHIVSPSTPLPLLSLVRQETRGAGNQRGGSFFWGQIAVPGLDPGTSGL
eukprot:scaffold89047_cov55-Phaeocystis_antarctica.AAC.2